MFRDRTVYIFGVFNPVTDAHMEMAHKARAFLGEGGRVVFVPASGSYIRQYKKYGNGDVMDAETRFKLLKEHASSFGYEVSGAEIEGETDGKTYNTVKYLKAEGSILCMGMDAFCSVPAWYEAKKLMGEMYFLVFNRFSREIPPGIVPIMERTKGTFVTNLEESFSGISSSDVRNAYRAGSMDEVKKLVPYNVYRYLKEEKNVYF